MPQLTEYENLNLDQIFDFNINKSAIESVLGILLFPVINEEITETGFKIIGSEVKKSFWGNKTQEKGHIKFQYLKTIESDLSDLIYHGYGEPSSLPEHANILLAFEFNSEYSKYHSFEKHCFPGHEMGKSRKEILSYGVLNNIIQEQTKAYNDIQLNYLKDGGDMLSIEFSVYSSNNYRRRQIGNYLKNINLIAS